MRPKLVVSRAVGLNNESRRSACGRGAVVTATYSAPSKPQLEQVAADLVSVEPRRNQWNSSCGTPRGSSIPGKAWPGLGKSSPTSSVGTSTAPRRRSGVEGVRGGGEPGRLVGAHVSSNKRQSKLGTSPDSACRLRLADLQHSPRTPSRSLSSSPPPRRRSRSVELPVYQSAQTPSHTPSAVGSSGSSIPHVGVVSPSGGYISPRHCGSLPGIPSPIGAFVSAFATMSTPRRASPTASGSSLTRSSGASTPTCSNLTPLGSQPRASFATNEEALVPANLDDPLTARGRSGGSEDPHAAVGAAVASLVASVTGAALFPPRDISDEADSDCVKALDTVLAKVSDVAPPKGEENKFAKAPPALEQEHSASPTPSMPEGTVSDGVDVEAAYPSAREFHDASAALAAVMRDVNATLPVSAERFCKGNNIPATNAAAAPQHLALRVQRPLHSLRRGTPLMGNGELPLLHEERSLDCTFHVTFLLPMGAWSTEFMETLKAAFSSDEPGLATESPEETVPDGKPQVSRDSVVVPYAGHKAALVTVQGVGPLEALNLARLNCHQQPPQRRPRPPPLVAGFDHSPCEAPVPSALPECVGELGAHSSALVYVVRRPPSSKGAMQATLGEEQLGPICAVEASFAKSASNAMDEQLDDSGCLGRAVPPRRFVAAVCGEEDQSNWLIADAALRELRARHVGPLPSTTVTQGDLGSHRSLMNRVVETLAAHFDRDSPSKRQSPLSDVNIADVATTTPTSSHLSSPRGEGSRTQGSSSTSSANMPIRHRM
mmetsp:Transcript_28677/g.78847  ORF Transcript_28677/g.78847 Transcript_28677/m.78847 type:complete len:774 (-) Transcript_28677:144-2465(-)